MERVDHLAADEHAGDLVIPPCPDDIAPAAWSEAVTMFTQAGGDLSNRMATIALRPMAKEVEREGTRREQRPGRAPALRTRRVREAIPYVTTRLLAERGFWTLTNTGPVELFEWEDLEGRLEVHPAAGTPVPGVFDAIVMNALVSRWASGPRDTADPKVTVSVSRLAGAMQLPETGPNYARIAQAIESLRQTRYRFVLESGDEGFADDFQLLDRTRTRWQGPPTSPNRTITAYLTSVVIEALSERRQVRPVDITTLRAIGPQREVARRLFLFLESRPGHHDGSGWDRVEHVLDSRLAHTLGTDVNLRELRRMVLRASDAIMDVASDRYDITVVPRRAREISPGEPRYLLRARRKRRAQ